MNLKNILQATVYDYCPEKKTLATIKLYLSIKYEAKYLEKLPLLF